MWVAGGSGFLGQNLVKQLLETSKYDVVIFDIREPPSSAGISGVEFVKGDLTQMKEICDALKGRMQNNGNQASNDAYGRLAHSLSAAASM